MSGEAGVRVERTVEGVATVVLDRPERYNAMDQAVFAALPELFAELAADDGVAAVVLTGAGPAFCAGADISGSLGFDTEAEGLAWMQATQRGPAALHALPQPTIAAINGPVAGAGLGLALLCDVRLAAPTASFSVPFVRMGIVADFGVSGTLPAIVGPSVAADLLLTGRKADPEEALRCGLISRVVADARAEGEGLAAKLAALPPGAAAQMKAQWRAAAGVPIERVLGELEPAQQAAATSAPGFREQAAAWFASRGG